MKVFITGITGFIGSYVAKALLDRGDSVVAFVRNPNKISSLCNHPNVSVIQGELAELEKLKSGLVGVDACVHIALGWGDTPEAMLRNDTLPTIALLEAASNAGCKQFLYTSSTAAMGEMRRPMHEDLRCIPTDLYGATKSASESFILGFRSTEMRCNIIRPGYTFGNPVVSDGVAQPDARFRNIAACAKQGKDIELINHDGTQFIHAADLAKVYLAVLDSQCNREVFLGLAYEWVSWENVAQQTISLCGSSSKIVLKDLGWGTEPIRFEVEKIWKQFSLRFTAWPALQSHIEWSLTKVNNGDTK